MAREHTLTPTVTGTKRARPREKERERETERASERGRERERERESDNKKIERERETDANPPQRGIPKYEANLTQKYFQGVTLQNYENKSYNINFRRIIYGKLHTRHVIPEKNYAKQFPGTYSHNNLVVRVYLLSGAQ